MDTGTPLNGLERLGADAEQHRVIHTGRSLLLLHALVMPPGVLERPRVRTSYDDVQGARKAEGKDY